MIKNPITGYPVAPQTRWHEDVSTSRQGQRKWSDEKGALGEEKRDYTNSLTGEKQQGAERLTEGGEETKDGYAWRKVN